MVDMEVEIAHSKIARDPDNLISRGLGSCVVVILYDPKLKIGALSHAVLPHQMIYENPKNDNPARFVDTAIDDMLHKMIALGCTRRNIEAKIVGGANMFPGVESSIGKDNVLSAREKLKKESIKITGEATSGTVGRSIEFSTKTGLATVKMMF